MLSDERLRGLIDAQGSEFSRSRAMLMRLARAVAEEARREAMEEVAKRCRWCAELRCPNCLSMTAMQGPTRAARQPDGARSEPLAEPRPTTPGEA